MSSGTILSQTEWDYQSEIFGVVMSNDERLAIKRLIELARTQALQMGAFDTADHLAQADLSFDRFMVEVEFRGSAREYNADWSANRAGLSKNQIN